MKILIASLSFNSYTGSELYVYELARSLVELGHEVDICANIGDDMVSKVEPFSIGCFDIRRPPNFMLGNGEQKYKVHGQVKVMQQGKFYRISAQHKYDLILTNQAQITKIIADLFDPTPVVQIVHSEIIPNFEDPIKVNNILGYIAIRDSIKEHLIKEWNIPKNWIEVIYNPVDIDRFLPLREVDHPKDRTLFMGSYDYLRKAAIDDLIDYTKKKGKKLILVGRGYPEFDEDHVETHEPTWDVEKFLEGVDETAGILLGRTTIESWCAGLPSIIYEVDSKGVIQDWGTPAIPNEVELRKTYGRMEVAQQILDHADNLLRHADDLLQPIG